MEATKSKKWVEAVQLIVENYNRRKHSTTKQTPNDLIQPGTNKRPAPLAKPRNRVWKVPKVGAFVRLNRLRNLFDKEASGTFTQEVFKVASVNKRFPIPMVRVVDLLGNPVKGSFYPEEIQEISWDSTKRVEKILKRRKLKGRPKEYLVTFEGYPSSYSEWSTRSK